MSNKEDIKAALKELLADKPKPKPQHDWVWNWFLVILFVGTIAAVIFLGR